MKTTGLKQQAVLLDAEHEAANKKATQPLRGAKAKDTFPMFIARQGLRGSVVLSFHTSNHVRSELK